MNTPADTLMSPLVAPTFEVRTEPIQQRSTERITALLDAAADLIDAQGIDALTTSEVAQRSGSSVGVVYRYFPNIQSLLRGLAARNVERFAERVRRAGTEIRPDQGWAVGVDATIDAYVDLMRTEPGFRALRFGEVIESRFVEAEPGHTAGLAGAFRDILVDKYGMPATPEFAFDLEVLVEVSGALLQRAFRYDRQGDERFIAKLRSLVHETLRPHELSAR